MPLYSVLFLLWGLLPLSVRSNEAFPTCVLECLRDAFRSQLCDAYDNQCLCGDDRFREFVANCVLDACTIPETLVAINATVTQCEGPTTASTNRPLVPTTYLLAGFAFVSVLLRFVRKVVIARLAITLDDWLALAAIVVMIPSAFLIDYGLARNGLGMHIWTLKPDKISRVLRHFHTVAWMYFLGTTLVKLALISFYLQIFPTRTTRQVLWGTFGFTAAWGTSFVLVAIFQCRPIEYFWTGWDGLHEGSCANANAIAWSNAASNIALDVWILAIPLWKLRALHLHWKKKVAVALMVCVGMLVTVMSALRLQSLVRFATTSNPTFDFYDVCLWSTVEFTVGVLCACLPSLRLLLVDLCPGMSGMAHGVSLAYGRERRGSKLHPSCSGRTHEAANSVLVTTESPDGIGPPGIVVRSTYSVLFQDAALVETPGDQPVLSPMSEDQTREGDGVWNTCSPTQAHRADEVGHRRVAASNGAI